MVKSVVSHIPPVLVLLSIIQYLCLATEISNVQNLGWLTFMEVNTLTNLLPIITIHLGESLHERCSLLPLETRQKTKHTSWTLEVSVKIEMRKKKREFVRTSKAAIRAIRSLPDMWGNTPGCPHLDGVLCFGFHGFRVDLARLPSQPFWDVFWEGNPLHQSTNRFWGLNNTKDMFGDLFWGVEIQLIFWEG